DRMRTDFRFVVFLLLSIAPTIMWTICKRAWGLQNAFTANPSAGLTQLRGRLFDGVSPQFLFKYLMVDAAALWMIIGLAVLVVLFSHRQKLKVPAGATIAAATAALHFSGLYFVYLSKPDLEWHLTTSATRTMAT